MLTVDHDGVVVVVGGEEAVKVTQNLQLIPITSDNVEQVRLINTILFPLKYQDRFYRQILEHGTFCRLGNQVSP